MFEDPLKIYYFLVLGTDDLDKATFFQGFSKSWASLHWALEALTFLPADILEPSHDIDGIVAQRIGGWRTLSWFPINVSAFEQLSTDELGPFTVLFSGEPNVATRTEKWAKSQPHPVLRVSQKDVDDHGIEKFRLETLRNHCKAILEARPDAFSKEQWEAGTTAVTRWSSPKSAPSGLKEHGHNILIPNHMTLRRAGRSMEKGEPFIGRSESEYTAVITESASAVTRIREETRIRPFHSVTLFRPGLILTEPALYRGMYRNINAHLPGDLRAVRTTLRSIQTQRGLCTEKTVEFIRSLMSSPAAQEVQAERQAELRSHTLGVGLHAAQITAAVLRLSPAVNHVFPELAAFAQNVRSPSKLAKRKTKRLFASVQNALLRAVGPERIEFIRKTGGPLKIVADAPIEWLPIGNLPLGLRYDCSRINATPGNLLMGLLAIPPALTLPPQAFSKILVISAFDDDDHLKDVLKDALDVIRDGWDKKIELVHKVARQPQEFAEALNSFDGSILIFDGHGKNNAADPVGRLVVGKTPIDVWDLRGKVRVPPIVILSACDTHGIDAVSQATVGNGFLSLGARTVLATLLPVGGYDSAGFIARLIIRIADFIPAALAARTRVLSWTEIISGMQRMLLASEILNALIGPPEKEGTPRASIQTQANVDINTREDEDWFDNLLRRIAQHRNEDLSVIELKAAAAIAHSEAIRYVQLGNPETILIDDGGVQDRLMSFVESAKSQRAH